MFSRSVENGHPSPRPLKSNLGEPESLSGAPGRGSPRPRIAETRGRTPRPLRGPQNLWTPEPGSAPCVPPLGPQLTNAPSSADSMRHLMQNSLGKCKVVVLVAVLDCYDSIFCDVLLDLPRELRTRRPPYTGPTDPQFSIILKVTKNRRKSAKFLFFLTFFAYFGVCNVFLCCRGSRCSRVERQNNEFCHEMQKKSTLSANTSFIPVWGTINLVRGPQYDHFQGGSRA